MGALAAGAGVAWWRFRPAAVASGAEAAFWEARFDGPSGETVRLADVGCETRLGGLLKHYSRKAA